MFTKEDLLREYKTLSLKPLNFLQTSMFSASDYPELGGEAGVSLCRGLVKDFDSAIQFYCNAQIVWGAEGAEFHT